MLRKQPVESRETLGQQYKFLVFLNLGAINAKCHSVICGEFVRISDFPFSFLKLASVYGKDKETPDR